LGGLSFYRGAKVRRRPCEIVVNMQKPQIPSIFSSCVVIDTPAPSIEDAAVRKAPTR
jgi:hypothetical protein